MLVFFLLACNQPAETVVDSSSADSVISFLPVPDTTVDKSSAKYQKYGGLWMLNEKPYSGYIVSNYPNGQQKEKFGVVDGKKEGLQRDWYPDGHMRSSTEYHLGKRHGEAKSWSSDSSHNLIVHLNYQKGKQHGIQRKWYKSGEIFKIRNLNMGREEGMQQAYRKNGILYANYEARNGRIFGFKRSKLCYELEEETVINY